MADKCSVTDCYEKAVSQHINKYLETVHRLCFKHSAEYLDALHRARVVSDMLDRACGTYEVVDFFKGYRNRVKKMVFDNMTYWLRFTDGKCSCCARKAVIMAGKTPFCEKHGFPRCVPIEIFKDVYLETKEKKRKVGR